MPTPHLPVLTRRFLASLMLLMNATPAAFAESDCTHCAIDEVIVTAQRHREDIANVPLSITSINGDTLRRDGIGDIGELTARVPGFAVNSNGIPSLYLRGIGSNDLGAGGDPSVGVYQDGIYLGRSTGSIFDLLDVERVEIIRGPQGVLFGRNSAGGAINIVTNQPAAAKQSSSLSAQFGSFNERRFTGMTNLPLTEQLNVRIAANSQRRDGFVYNAYSQRPIIDIDQWSTRLGIAYTPTAALTATLQLSVEKKDNDGLSSRSTNQRYLTGTPYDAYYSDLDHGLDKRELRFANVHIAYEPGEWTLSSATGYRTIEHTDLVDSTGSGLFARRLYSGTEEQNRQLSEDVLLQRDFNGSHWTFGVGYYRQRADQLSHLESTTDTVNFAVSRQLGVPITVVQPGLYQEENSLNGGLAQSVSAFIDLTTKLSTRWDLITGIRYSHDNKEHKVDGQGSNNGIAIVFADTPAITSNASWTDWTPRVGLNFHGIDNTLLYLQYGEGYKSGGFNSFVPDAEFAPEHIDQFELGAKWFSDNRRLQAQLAVFDYRYRDLQVSVIEDSKVVIRNAARAHGNGIDAEFTAQLTSHWRTGINAGWLHTEFTNFITGNTARNLAGNRLTYTPDRQLSAFVDHQFDCGSLNVRSSLHYSYSGKQYFDTDNAPAESANSINLLDASVTLANTNAHWRTTLFGKNMTDTQYVTFIGGLAKDSLDAPASKRGLPRTIGLRVELLFD
jgi:iron complex outermembrane recepter protein